MFTKIEQWENLNKQQSDRLRGFIQKMEEQRRLRYKVDYCIFAQADAPVKHLVCLAKEKIIGYAVVSQYAPVEIEVTLICPEDNELVESLLTRIKQEAAASKAQRLLFISDSRDHFMVKMLEQNNCSFFGSEWSMELDREAAKELVLTDDNLDLNYARQSDANEVARLWNQGAEDSEINLHDLEKTLVYHENGRVAVAIRVDESPERYAIYGFVVHPGLRGSGLGKKVFSQVVKQLSRSSKRTIYLEVEAENVPACCLYYTMGFRMVSRMDYYEAIQ